jgi:hypothetical protein
MASPHLKCGRLPWRVTQTRCTDAEWECGFGVARFALHSGLRQSGAGLRPGFYGTAEAVPFRVRVCMASPHLKCGRLPWRGDADSM